MHEKKMCIRDSSTAKDSAGNLLGQEIANQANEITGGKLTVDYHGTGELGGDTDLVRQEQSNDIQMVIMQPAPMVSFVPDMAVFDPVSYTHLVLLLLPTVALV